jgi:hypothetical protein
MARQNLLLQKGAKLTGQKDPSAFISNVSVAFTVMDQFGFTIFVVG